MGSSLDTGSGCTTPSKADAVPPVTPSATPPLRPGPSLAAPHPAMPAPVEGLIRKTPERLSKQHTHSPDHLNSFHNYMDYSDDSCMNNFTPGQCSRLTSQIATDGYDRPFFRSRSCITAVE